MSGFELVALSVAAHAFLKEVAGPLGKAIGEEIRDRYLAWRLENLSAVVEAAARKHDSSGATTVPIPPRALVPLLEGASLEDDQMLRECWAGLLANAAHKPDDNTALFVEILRRLRPIDARVLDCLFEHQNIRFSTRFYLDELQNLDQQGIAREHLTQLALIRAPTDLHLTAIAEAFLRACKGPWPGS